MTHSLHIGAETIKASLERILASQTFSRSEKLRKFLAYVVENEQGGKAQALKGYSIGVDVFSRPEEFDPAGDPLVRVQAGKLRKLLDSYYESEGRNDFVRITIPRGGYVPKYQINKSECPPPDTLLDRMPTQAPVRQTPAPPRRVKRRYILAAVCTLANLALATVNVTAFQLGMSAPTPLATTPSARDTALPRLTIASQSTAPADFRLIGEAMIAVAAQMPTVEVITGNGEQESRANEAGPLDFRLEIASDASTDRLKIMLSHTATGSVIYNATYATGMEDRTSSRIEAIAVDALYAILPVSGEIYRFALIEGLASDLMQCLTMTELYNNTNSRLAYFTAVGCQNRLTASDRTDNIYSSLRMLRDASRASRDKPLP